MKEPYTAVIKHSSPPREAGVGGDAKGSIDAVSDTERAQVATVAREQDRPKGDQVVKLPVVALDGALSGEVGDGRLVVVGDAFEDSTWFEKQPEPIVSAVQTSSDALAPPKLGMTRHRAN